jgi:PAS domain-containing protein
MTLSESLTWLAGTIGSVTVIIATVKWGIPYLVRLVRATAAADDLARNLGGKAGRAIKEMMVEIYEAIDIASAERAMLAKHVNVGIYICEPSGECTSANPVLANMFGMQISEMHGWGWTRAVKVEQRKRVREAWQHSVEGHLPYEATYLIEPLNGKPECWVRTAAVPVMNRDKKEPICYVGWITPCDAPTNRKSSARRALIVDDDPKVRRVSQVLMPGPHMYAQSMCDALALFDNNDFDCAAFDLSLEDSEPEETVRTAVREILPRVERLVFFTGCADLDRIRKMPEASKAHDIGEKLDVLTRERWRQFVTGMGGLTA